MSNGSKTFLSAIASDTLLGDLSWDAKSPEHWQAEGVRYIYDLTPGSLRWRKAADLVGDVIERDNENDWEFQTLVDAVKEDVEFAHNLGRLSRINPSRVSCRHERVFFQVCSYCGVNV